MAAAAFVAAPLGAQTFFDGDFVGWTFGATGTATVTRELTGGNPGARLNITTVSGPTVDGTAVNPLWVTSGSLVGTAFSLSMDFLSGPGAFGLGQGVGLLIQQGGALYYSHVGFSFTSVGPWSLFSQSSTFDPFAFALIAGSGPANPLLNGGTLTTFGFAGRNDHSGTLTNYYDNVKLTISPTTTVPEPTSLVLVAGGLAALAAIARRHCSCSASST